VLGEEVEKMKAVRPYVSVIMPAYNAERTVGAAIESVLAQTLSNIELLVCDDDSRDHTWSVLGEYDDPRIRKFKNEKNIGAGRTRDILISRSKGTWVAFIDSDDAWHSDRLRLLAEAGKKHESTFVFDDIWECHDTAAGLKKWKRVHGPTAFGADTNGPVVMTAASYISSPRMLIKPLIHHDLIKEKNVQHKNIPFGEDAHFFLQLMHGGAAVSYCPKALYLYRITPGSATANPQKNQWMAKVIEEAKCWGWPRDEEVLALNKKSQEFRGKAEYAGLIFRLKSRNLSEVMKAMLALVSSLRMSKMLFSRVLQDVRYHSSVFLNGGRRR
jgi:succinoglycan biosynthesis protein ExoO